MSGALWRARYWRPHLVAVVLVVVIERGAVSTWEEEEAVGVVWNRGNLPRSPQ